MNWPAVISKSISQFSNWDRSLLRYGGSRFLSYGICTYNGESYHIYVTKYFSNKLWYAKEASLFKYTRHPYFLGSQPSEWSICMKETTDFSIFLDMHPCSKISITILCDLLCCFCNQSMSDARQAKQTYSQPLILQC